MEKTRLEQSWKKQKNSYKIGAAVEEGKKMRRGLILLIGIMGVLFLAPISLSGEDFSKERALEHVRYLAETVGPRPMGSPQEKAALTYVAGKLAEYGCQVEWQPVTSSKNINTSSFNVIGRFPGERAGEIIIGGHVDSASPEIPGADDDASGVAAMLEIARILCLEKHHSTLVFVAFCGEESGLVGSENFAEHYPLENAGLMLELDMTSDDAPLLLWIDTRQAQTPEWLVRASIDAFHSLGYRNIDYPFHFNSLNSSLGGAGSDHEPFLKKGIPAIALVSDVRFPIHTQFDSLAYFKPDGLERSGRLVLALVQKFDRELPKAKTGHYMLILAGERPLFIKPVWPGLFIILSIAFGILALVHAWEKRARSKEDKRSRFSWPKLLVVLLIIVIVTFASQWTMQLLKGQRLPWFAHPGFYFVYAFFFMLLGLWLALQLTRKWKLRKSAFFYLVRAAAYFSVLIALTLVLGGPRLGLYPAAGLFLVSLACLVPWGWLKGLLWVLSPYMMFRLIVLPEYYEFVYRTAGLFGLSLLKTSLAFGLFIAAYILFTLFWTMPFLLGFAAVYRSYSGDLLRLKSFRRPLLLVPLGMLIIGGGVYLLKVPSYARPWEQVITVSQKSDGFKNKTSIEFSSSDYLRGIETDIGGQGQTINERSCVKEIDYPLEMDWVKDKIVSRSEESGADQVVSLDIALDFARQPFTVSLSLKSDRAMKIEESNIRSVSKGKKGATITWFSFPEGQLGPKLKVRLPKEATLTAEFSATFLEKSVPISCQGQNKSFVYRTVITRKINSGCVPQGDTLPR
jgi:hypothetical protein